MKKTDIEDFERRNIYDVPEGFFKDMQNNVLEKVAEHEKPKGKILPMRVLSGIAASLALIAGTILFYYSNNNTMQTKEKIVDREILAENIQPKIAENSYSKEEPSDEGSGEEIAENQKKSHDGFNFSENSASNSKKETLTDSKNTYNGPKVINVVDNKFDKALSNLSSQELAEQSKKYEIDTYLDLY
ncbi:hypothetical protein HZP94_11960 [Elizabethkingia anophelis]|nr:hypothetical protein [Elizabethkingia anophelis]MCT4062487.1 hypothetical protein [Elizabethkingia anophelis]MCT4108778.1 hypothetical protein [Elizabethkingia anophelis]